MKFETAIEYIEYLDKQSGESWSNATNELADAMEDYAKMYHERKLKLLGIADVGNSLPSAKEVYDNCDTMHFEDFKEWYEEYEQ